MKKLLITTLAAVSVGLCAKADFAENGTSFEGLTEGDVFNPADTYWTIPTDTDDVFKITNVTYSADATPQHWDLTTGEMALSIDTANPILRNVNPVSNDDTTIINPPQDVTTPVFFDSVVQFTATDVAPSMENNTTDKLAVWLYTSPDDVSDTNLGLFGETLPIRKVAVTAGYLDGATLKTKNYITDIEVEPDTWHRLTIKSFKNDIGDLLFNIWVDGTQVSGKETFEGQTIMTDFLSRISDAVNSDTYNKLQAVAFDGKGAVDDIVFTTTDPFAVASYKVTVKIDDADYDTSYAYKQYSVDGGVTYVALNEDKVYGDGDILEIPQTATKVMFKIAITTEEKKLEGVDESAGEYEVDGEVSGYYWIKEVNVADIISNGEGEVVLKVVDNTSTPEVTTYAVTVNSANATVVGLAEKYAADTSVIFAVTANQGYEVVSVMMNATVLSANAEGKYSFTMPAEAVTITVTTKAIEEEVTYPSVGGVETPEYSDNAKAAIDAAFPENSYPTGGLTVKVNGETLTGDPAVAMLNDAVEMFTLAGDAKFFDEDGVMDISFKATNPLMETETAEATDYEAKVGEATATVTSNYTVNKETVDLTPGVAGENEAVTFKLVIKPAGSTGSDAGSAVQE